MIFNSVVDVLENTGTKPGPFGKPVSNWVVRRSGVKCSVQRADGREAHTDAGTVEVVDFVIFGPVNPPWTGASRLQYRTQVLQVVDVDTNVVERGHHSETMCRKVGSSG